MINKCYIVGSGIVGCIIAQELAKLGVDVLIYERRNHVGGNLYDFIDEHGIRVHLYGPHIFHTKIERVWKYISHYCEFTNYNLVCGAVINNKCVPTSFDFSSIDVFFPEEKEIIKSHIKQIFGSQKSATILELLDCNDEYIKKFAEFLYNNDYAPYTAKQWGISPALIDKQIFKRVPILFSYGSKYFDDPYQAIPTNGYTELINNLLDHKNIKIRIKENALDHISIKETDIYLDNNILDGILVYTGPIDELFGYVYGKLPYRSLRFEWKYEENTDSFQDMPVVAYPQADNYTRITEYKKLPYQNVRGTTYAVEYPIPYNKSKNNEPYYPVLTQESKEIFKKYNELANKYKKIICCGRLADFKYYNMDEAIDRALTVVNQIKNL